MIIDVDDATILRVVSAELRNTREAFISYLSENTPNVFSLNPEEDKQILREHINALDLLLDWYEEPC